MLFCPNCSLNLDKSDPVFTNNMTIRVNGSGHVLHAYVNGKLVGNKLMNFLVYTINFDII